MDVNLFDIFGFPFGFPGSTPVWMTFVGLTRGECWDVCHGGKCDKRSWQKKHTRRLSQSPRLSGEQKKSSKWSHDTLRKAPWAYRYAWTPIYRVMASCVTKCNVIQYQLRFLAWNNLCIIDIRTNNYIYGGKLFGLQNYRPPIYSSYINRKVLAIFLETKLMVMCLESPVLRFVASGATPDFIHASMCHVRKFSRFSEEW